MKKLACLLIAGLLSACGGGNRQVAIENPYLEKAEHYTQSGMTAMQRERWNYAQTAFERALAAAQLTDDPGLIAQTWYNLGMARKSGGETTTAEAAFRMAWKTAERENDTLTVLRARLALALMQQQPAAWRPATLPATLPPDIHLSAARLAQRQHRTETARNEYRQALKRSDESRQGLIYRGQAYLGLGVLAGDNNDPETARRDTQQALTLFRQVGSPRLIAYTLLRLSEVDTTDAARTEHIRRALTIYRAMHDEAGQRACIEALKRVKSGE